MFWFHGNHLVHERVGRFMSDLAHDDDNGGGYMYVWGGSSLLCVIYIDLAVYSPNV
jgi:hypothetical protein